jgi:Mur ligase family, glutamate ligase domain
MAFRVVPDLADGVPPARNGDRGRGAVIGKICPRGQDVAGLIRYLYGPGRREEHTDSHIIVGYRPPRDLEPPLRASVSRDFRRLAGLLRLPHDALGKWGYAKPVWHCSMRAAPEDRLLSDAEWAGIARDVMHRTGLCPRRGRRRGAVDRDPAWPQDRHEQIMLDLHAPHRGPALCLNASRAAITALELGVPAQTIRDGISGYRGVSRRLELRHSRNGVLMLDDYAHNPAQITELARALRGYYPGRRLIAIFEPR